MANIKEAEQTLAEILAQREYQIYYEDNRNILQIWWDRFWEWIGDLFSRWFQAFEPTSTVGDMIIAILILVVIILVLVLLFLLISNVTKKRRLRSLQPLQSSVQSNWGSKQHLTEASRLEEQGDYQQATRHLFLALLLSLHEEERLVAQKWKTNWEYYQELLRSNREYAEDFYQFAFLFEEVTYGEKQIDSNAYQAYQTKIVRWLDEIHQSTASDEKVEG